jgi:hypothetical protein
MFYPGANPGRRGGKPATNRLSYGTALGLGYYSSMLFHLTEWLVYVVEKAPSEYKPNIITAALNCVIYVVCVTKSIVKLLLLLVVVVVVVVVVKYSVSILFLNIILKEFSTFVPYVLNKRGQGVASVLRKHRVSPCTLGALLQPHK